MKHFWFIILFNLHCCINDCKAQEMDSTGDKHKESFNKAAKHSAYYILDSSQNSRSLIYKSITQVFVSAIYTKENIVSKNKSNSLYFNKPEDLTSITSNKPYKKLNFKKSFLKISGGLVSYNFNYRSTIDTPFIEKDIMQHNAYGNINVSLFNIPLKVNYLLRRSNSTFFSNISDVQIEFDSREFNSGFRSAFKEKLLKEAEKLHDNLLELNYKSTLEKLKISSLWFNDPLIQQKFTECREILNVPDLTYNTRYSDSVSKNTSAKIKDSAQVFINEYDSKKQELDQLKSKADSLELDCRKMYSKMQLYKNLIRNNQDGNAYLGGLQESISRLGVNGFNIPKKYRLLSGIQKFGIGRNQLNYSELTIKNMSLTGVNFEYNSWYYFAFATGKIDYRFRDFVINPLKRNTQHITLARIGVGRLEGNHLIITAYTGEKRLFTVTNNSAGQQ